MTELKLDDIKNLDFETAFTALEENVSQLENEELALEKALALYERGQLLARRCADLLESAELKMRQLSEDPED
ncbi:MAG: exodeoxyribonuclease VII small subunit [Chloroflexota bacterium]|nr:exodeoxyribonuclease VII small subunit [Chloroflexota bacterium]